MNTGTQLLTQALKEHGMSVTETRSKVFGALEGSGPLSMNELITRISPEVHRTSAYRTIELFEKHGIVQRIQIGWKYKLELSNEFQYHHHHLICTNCGRIESFQEPDSMHDILERIATEKQFTLQRHQLELQGLCSRCQTVK